MVMAITLMKLSTFMLRLKVGLIYQEKIFGVCGSGDTFYDDFVNRVDDFEAVFTQIGAKKGADSVKVDLAAEETTSNV